MEQEITLTFEIETISVECQICRIPPKPHSFGFHLYLCGAGGVVCGSCMSYHKASCGASHSSDCCRFLEDIGSRIEVECACGYYFQYRELKEHQNGCSLSKICTSAWRKCRLNTMLLRCSMKKCRATLRPPVFKPRSSDFLICAKCYGAETNKNNLVSCPDMDYLLKCMMVMKRCPCFSPCDETNSTVGGSNIIIGKTNGMAPSKVGKMDKHIVERHELETGKRVAEASLKTYTCNKNANIATAYAKKTDEYESTRPPADNSTNNGKIKGKAPSKVHKMDNHIVDSDVVESDDDSSDDIHPETGKRVAETMLKTSGYTKKAKIATPSGGQKTGDKMGSPVVTLHLANN